MRSLLPLKWVGLSPRPSLVIRVYSGTVKTINTFLINQVFNINWIICLVQGLGTVNVAEYTLNEPTHFLWIKVRDWEASFA